MDSTSFYWKPNIKLSSVASDILGMSGRKIIRALIAGEQRPEWLADEAASTLRNKREELRLILCGEVSTHHRYLLQELIKTGRPCKCAERGIDCKHGGYNSEFSKDRQISPMDVADSKAALVKALSCFCAAYKLCFGHL